MDNVKKQISWLMVLLSLAAAAAAQQMSIDLPTDNPASQLKRGSGDDTVRRNCSVCHSTDYIVRQPHLDAMHWQAEVQKMITIYGARINESDAKVIADYLTKNYGPEERADDPKARGGKH
jgi:sulfite dehydrogenase (cytochrome) subunit B